MTVFDPYRSEKSFSSLLSSVVVILSLRATACFELLCSRGERGPDILMEDVGDFMWIDRKWEGEALNFF